MVCRNVSALLNSKKVEYTMINLGKISKATKGMKVDWWIEPTTFEPGPYLG